MELFEAVYGRRSVRSYSGKKISGEDLEKVLDAGRYAPSACDIQGWRFVVIDSDKVKKDLVDMGAASFIEKAPIGVLVAYDNQTDNLEYMDYVQSAAACIQNMMLAAHSLGIGCCWICHLPRKKDIRRLLSIPTHYDPIAYVAMGYPEKEPRRKERKRSLEALTSYNRYRAENDNARSRLHLGIKRVMRKAYYRLPFRKHVRGKADDLLEKRFE